MTNLLLRKKTIHEEDNDRVSSESAAQNAKNVIVFGESGVGKSSLINLIAGEKVSATSSGALGCTLEYKRHSLKLHDEHYDVWDTAGLDEGSQGAIPAEKAEAYLKRLLHELAKNNGVDLLIYCVRGTRVRTALLTNYHIFYSAICRKKVPIAIVITGLENQEGDMDMWWRNNESQFAQLKMHFDGHACVTTLETSVDNATLRERRKISQTVVTDMIINTCRSQQWKPPELSWIESAYSDIRAMLSPRDALNGRPANIIMCEMSRPNIPRPTRKRSISFQSPISLSFSLPPLSFRSPLSVSSDTLLCKLPFEEGIRRIHERPFRVYRVPRNPASPESEEEEAKKTTIVKRGADLLLFCVDATESESTVKFQWEHFNLTYGGELSPQIVVVVGAADQSSAKEWWNNAVGGSHVNNDVDVAHLPQLVNEPGPEEDDARKRLQCLINERCIDCTKVPPTKNEKLFRRSLHLDMSSLTTLWVRPEGSHKEEPGAREPDVLTKQGVWVAVPDRSPGTTELLPSQTYDEES